MKQSLYKLMSAPEFKSFRLVGGTSLSLQLGHRISIDIDLFSDASYGSIDFEAISSFLKQAFSYVDYQSNLLPAVGRSYTVGTDRQNLVKLDVFYSEPFVQPFHWNRYNSDGYYWGNNCNEIRRCTTWWLKNDFWDLHELLQKYGVEKMLSLHKLRYEYNHQREVILENFTDFSNADNDFEPICLKGKYWEFIKEDIELALAANDKDQ